MATNKEERYRRRRLQTAYISTVISISLVLFMMGLLGLIILKAHRVSEVVKENISLEVIMKETAREAEILEMKKSLDASEYVKSTQYVTKEKAAEELQEILGEDFIGFLGYNPLLPTIDVKVKAVYANNDSLEIIVSNLSKAAPVKEVIYQQSLVQLINDNIQRIGIILLGLSLVLLFIAIALINNTIRLSVYSKRFLIRTMQLVGASQAYIRRPFVNKGIVQGFLGGLLAMILLGLSMYLMQSKVPDIIDIADIDLYLQLFAMVTVIGIVIAWFSTFFAVQKYLKMKIDNLYYY
jgi:cell division transport system permease protein